MANLNPQAWAIPQIIITTPPTATAQEINQYQQELINLCTGLTNISAFVSFQNHVNLPNILAPMLGVNVPQPVIDSQIETLNLYCAVLINAQGFLVHLLNQNVQNQNTQNPLAPWSTIKAPKPEFDSTPGEKAHKFITACTMYWTLQPDNFPNDEVLIAWALVCINDDSKAALWKAHWLTLQTENIGAGCTQPVTLTNWDTFAHEFLGKFINLSKTQRMQWHLVEMRQKTSCRDHTQEFNWMALLARMNGNQVLPWLFCQSLKNDIQCKLLHERFNTLEQLQTAAIATDNLLFSFRKQNQGDQTTTWKPKFKPKQNEYQPNVPTPQENSPTNNPNTMELNCLSTEEYWRQWVGGLCFKCGKRGLAHNCLQHNDSNHSNNNWPQQGQYQQWRLGRLLAIEATPENTDSQGANLTITQAQELDSPDLRVSTSQSADTTQEPLDFLHSWQVITPPPQP